MAFAAARAEEGWGGSGGAGGGGTAAPPSSEDLSDMDVAAEPNRLLVRPGRTAQRPHLGTR